MNQSTELLAVEASLVSARAEKFGQHKHLLRVYPPFWCEEGSDDRCIFFEEYKFLLDHGNVAWGAIVQANQHL